MAPANSALRNEYNYLSELYRRQPDWFSEGQVDRIEHMGRALGERFSRDPNASRASLGRTVRQAASGFVSGLTTIQVGDAPENTPEAIARNVGSLFGFLGVIPGAGTITRMAGVAIGGAALRAGGALGKSSQVAGFAQRAEQMGASASQAVAARGGRGLSVPLIVGGMITDRARGPVTGAVNRFSSLSAPVRDKIADAAIEGVRLGAASGVASWQGGVDEVVRGMSMGAFEGAAFRGLTNWESLGKMFAAGGRQAQHANMAVRMVSSSIYGGALSAAYGDPWEMQIYHYLLGAWFGKTDVPLSERRASQFLSRLNQDVPTGPLAAGKTSPGAEWNALPLRERLINPQRHPQFKSLPKETAEQVVEQAMMRYGRQMNFDEQALGDQARAAAAESSEAGLLFMESLPRSETFRRVMFNKEFSSRFDRYSADMDHTQAYRKAADEMAGWEPGDWSVNQVADILDVTRMDVAAGNLAGHSADARDIIRQAAEDNQLAGSIVGPLADLADQVASRTGGDPKTAARQIGRVFRDTRSEGFDAFLKTLSAQTGASPGGPGSPMHRSLRKAWVYMEQNRPATQMVWDPRRRQLREIDGTLSSGEKVTEMRAPSALERALGPENLIIVKKSDAGTADSVSDLHEAISRVPRGASREQADAARARQINDYLYQTASTGRPMLFGVKDKGKFRHTKGWLFDENSAWGEQMSLRLAQAERWQPGLRASIIRQRAEFAQNVGRPDAGAIHDKLVYNNMVALERINNMRYDQMARHNAEGTGQFVLDAPGINKRMQPLDDGAPSLRPADLAGIERIAEQGGLRSIIVSGKDLSAEGFEHALLPTREDGNVVQQSPEVLSDGIIYLRGDVFDQITRFAGNHPESGFAKLTIAGGEQSGKGAMISKLGAFRAPPAVEALMASGNLDVLQYDTAVKQRGTRDVYQMTLDGQGSARFSLGGRQTDPVADLIQPGEIHVNLGVYESPPEPARMAKQMLLNMVGGEARRSMMERHLRPSVEGTKQANELISRRDALSGDELASLNPDDIGLGPLLRALTEPDHHVLNDSPLYQKIWRHILGESRKADSLDAELLADGANMDEILRHAGVDSFNGAADRVIKTAAARGLLTPAVLNMGVTAPYTEAALRKYLVNRITRPVVPYSGKAVSYGQDLFTQQSLGRPLGPDQFAFADGMRDMPVRWLDGTEVTLGEAWRQRQSALDPDGVAREQARFEGDYSRSMGSIFADWLGDPTAGRRRLQAFLARSGVVDPGDVASFTDAMIGEFTEARSRIDDHPRVGEMDQLLEFSMIRVPADSPAGTRQLRFAGFSDSKGYGVHLGGDDMINLGGMDNDGDTVFYYQDLDRGDPLRTISKEIRRWKNQWTDADGIVTDPKAGASQFTPLVPDYQAGLAGGLSPNRLATTHIGATQGNQTLGAAADMMGKITTFSHAFERGHSQGRTIYKKLPTGQTLEIQIKALAENADEAMALRRLLMNMAADADAPLGIERNEVSRLISDKVIKEADIFVDGVLMEGAERDPWAEYVDLSATPYVQQMTQANRLSRGRSGNPGDPMLSLSQTLDGLAGFAEYMYRAQSATTGNLFFDALSHAGHEITGHFRSLRPHLSGAAQREPIYLMAPYANRDFPTIRNALNKLLADPNALPVLRHSGMNEFTFGRRRLTDLRYQSHGEFQRDMHQFASLMVNHLSARQALAQGVSQRKLSGIREHVDAFKYNYNQVTSKTDHARDRNRVLKESRLGWRSQEQGLDRIIAQTERFAARLNPFEKAYYDAYMLGSLAEQRFSLDDIARYEAFIADQNIRESHPDDPYSEAKRRLAGDEALAQSYGALSADQILAEADNRLAGQIERVYQNRNSSQVGFTLPHISATSVSNFIKVYSGLAQNNPSRDTVFREISSPESSRIMAEAFGDGISPALQEAFDALFPARNTDHSPSLQGYFDKLDSSRYPVMNLAQADKAANQPIYHRQRNAEAFGELYRNVHLASQGTGLNLDAATPDGRRNAALLKRMEYLWKELPEHISEHALALFEGQTGVTPPKATIEDVQRFVNFMESFRRKTFLEQAADAVGGYRNMADGPRWFHWTWMPETISRRMGEYDIRLSDPMRRPVEGTEGTFPTEVREVFSTFELARRVMSTAEEQHSAIMARNAEALARMTGWMNSESIAPDRKALEQGAVMMREQLILSDLKRRAARNKKASERFAYAISVYENMSSRAMKDYTALAEKTYTWSDPDGTRHTATGRQLMGWVDGRSKTYRPGKINESITRANEFVWNTFIDPPGAEGIVARRDDGTLDPDATIARLFDAFSGAPRDDQRIPNIGLKNMFELAAEMSYLHNHTVQHNGQTMKVGQISDLDARRRYLNDIRSRDRGLPGRNPDGTQRLKPLIGRQSFDSYFPHMGHSRSAIEAHIRKFYTDPDGTMTDREAALRLKQWHGEGLLSDAGMSKAYIERLFGEVDVGTTRDIPIERPYGNLDQRSMDAPLGGWDRSLGVYESYMNALSKSYHNLFGVTMARQLRREFADRAPLGEASETWAKFLDISIQDFTGQPSTFPSSYLGDKALGLQRSPYYLMSDEFAEKLYYGLGEKLGVITPLHKSVEIPVSVTKRGDPRPHITSNDILLWDDKPVGPELPRRGAVPFHAKDQSKSDMATKFIGRGSEGSSTEGYRQAWGERANSGEYTASDRVFVSAEGRRPGRLPLDQDEVIRAMDAGAVIIGDDRRSRARRYNVGERELAQLLRDGGYREINPGIWAPRIRPDYTPLTRDLTFSEARAEHAKRVEGAERMRSVQFQNRLREMTVLEGKYSLLTLLANTRSMVNNYVGGHSMNVISAGWNPFRRASSLDYIKNNVDPALDSWDKVAEFAVRGGAIESWIQHEVGPRQAGTAAVRRFTAEVRDKMLADPSVSDLTIREIARRNGVSDLITSKGGWFMRKAERDLRVKSFMAHYIKARDTLMVSKGGVATDDPWLISMAQKGVWGTQFLYNNANRPAFARTNLGRIFSRFQMWSWRSISFRRDVIGEASRMGWAQGTPEQQRFERMASIDTFMFALAAAFPMSMFENSLGSPWHYLLDFTDFFFGDEHERDAAFFGTIPYPFSPLQVTLPPSSRIPFTGINAAIAMLSDEELDARLTYQLTSLVPFGLLGRNVYRSAADPSRALDHMTGIPTHRMSRELRELREDPQMGPMGLMSAPGSL